MEELTHHHVDHEVACVALEDLIEDDPPALDESTIGLSLAEC